MRDSSNDDVAGDHDRTPPGLPTGRQLPIELILIRQLADLIPTAMFLADPEGRLLYYNEPAASLAEVPFDDIGHCRIDRCMPTFVPTDSNGCRIADNAVPLLVALRAGQPIHQQLSVRTREGTSRSVAVTALPITALGGTRLGAVAICWETDPT